MTTATLYTINDIKEVAAKAGATIQHFTAIAVPSQESIAEGCDAVDYQNLITITRPDGFALVYFQVGTVGWDMDPQSDTTQEFCEREYAGDEWAFYILNQVERF